MLRGDNAVASFLVEFVSPSIVSTTTYSLSLTIITTPTHIQLNADNNGEIHTYVQFGLKVCAISETCAQLQHIHMHIMAFVFENA